TASEYVAELVINAAAYRLVIYEGEQGEALEQLKEKVRKAEQKTIEHLLALYGFTNNKLQLSFHAQVEGRWQQDLFHPATLQIMGIISSKGLDTGAAFCDGFEVVKEGLSLVVGTVLSATLGAGALTWRYYRSRLQQWWEGKRVLTVEDVLLRALIL